MMTKNSCGTLKKIVLRNVVGKNKSNSNATGDNSANLVITGMPTARVDQRNRVRPTIPVAQTMRKPKVTRTPPAPVAILHSHSHSPLPSIPTARHQD